MNSYRVVSTTDSQHIGELVTGIEEGNILTFQDGDVVAIDRVLFSDDKASAIVINPNYQMNLEKE